jgi:hypothetical protein
MRTLRFAVAFAMLAMLAVAVQPIPVGAQPVCTRTGNDNANNLPSTSGPDVLCARGGDDRVAGRGVLVGGIGSDLIDATGGDDDTVRGGGGRDVCYVDDGDSTRGCEREI